MPWNQQSDLEDAMSPATVAAIFDDAGAADGTVNTGAIAAVLRRANAQISSFVARNYPNLTLPEGTEGQTVPETLKAAELEFAIVYARDRKPEYWSKSQEGERQQRIKGAFEMAERYAKAEQIAFDSGASPPANVGATVQNSNADDPDVKPRWSDDMGDF